MSVNIQIRRDSAADWTTEDPTLSEGELGLELDTGKIKIGDGATAWTSLSYRTYVTAVTENLTLNATNISNKYIDLANTPLYNTAVKVFPAGGIKQLYTTDFTVITDGSDVKRLNWDSLGLESYLADGDIISVDYIY